METVLEGLLEGMDADAGAILGVREGRDTTLIGYKHRSLEVKTFHKVSQYVSGEVLSSREAVLATNVKMDPTLRNRESLAELKVGSLICRAGDFRGAGARADPSLYIDHKAASGAR